MGDSLLLPLFSFSGIDVNGSTRLSPTPSVSNLSLWPCYYLSTVTQSSSWASVHGFRRERLQLICDLWFALGAKAQMKTNGKENYHVLPRWNLEAIGAVGANLRPFSFGGSVEPLRWSAQHWSVMLKRRPCRLQTADCADHVDCADSADWVLFFFYLYLNFLVKFLL